MRFAPVCLFASFAFVACQGARPTDLFVEDSETADGGNTGGDTSGTGGGAGASSAGSSTAGSGSAGSSTAGSSTAGSSTGGSSAGSTGGSSTAGQSDGPSCTVGGAPCPAGSVCYASDCTKGRCAPATVGEDALAPVCGCNGFTYWNERLAATRGISVRAKGECSATALACGGITDPGCPGATYCSRRVASATACVGAPRGTCWVVPPKCNEKELGPKQRPCPPNVGSACVSLCEAIMTNEPFFEDGTCN